MYVHTCVSTCISKPASCSPLFTAFFFVLSSGFLSVPLFFSFFYYALSEPPPSDCLHSSSSSSSWSPFSSSYSSVFSLAVERNVCTRVSIWESLHISLRISMNLYSSLYELLLLTALVSITICWTSRHASFPSNIAYLHCHLKIMDSEMRLVSGNNLLPDKYIYTNIANRCCDQRSGVTMIDWRGISKEERYLRLHRLLGGRVGGTMRDTHGPRHGDPCVRRRKGTWRNARRHRAWKHSGFECARLLPQTPAGTGAPWEVRVRFMKYLPSSSRCSPHGTRYSTSSKSKRMQTFQSTAFFFLSRILS